MKKLIALLNLIGLLSYGAGSLEIRAPGYGFQEADYSTSHIFIDEIANITSSIEVFFDLNDFSNITDVEVFSNVNRRDLARIDKDADGYADGIHPPNGNLITDSLEHTNSTNGHYYVPINMNDGDTNKIYELTIPITKTGCYRLTARFKTSDLIPENNYDANNWIWYGLRDHAIVVSPTDARNIRLYEINVFNIDANGASFEERSTIEDLHDDVSALQSDAESGNWNLDYLKNLGMNWLWFQPIHPNGIDGREPSEGWGSSSPSYDPGSPYAVKNFFEVNELMTVNYDPNNSVSQNRELAMLAWSNFVSVADDNEVGIMLDAPFNHTSHDVELSQKGVDLFQPDGEVWLTTDEIRNREARFFSKIGDYGNRASSSLDIATAPDRQDFPGWQDTKDVYFGRYDSLVEFNDGGSELNSHRNEGDWFDSDDVNWNSDDFVQNGENWNVTRRVWDYFAEYIIHWLNKTRPEGSNRNSTVNDGSLSNRYAWDQKGIDGVRCDFGQGLPPRCWEYIINVARSYKWNLVMMSESLDGGAVTYRSSRHFDVLNENIVFDLKHWDSNLPKATDAYAYRTLLENRRNAYGQGLVLLNNTSHDERNLSDPWEAVIFSSALGMVDGITMIFPGQELGLSYDYGYTHFETGFEGKSIPHFKKWNSMMPLWQDTNFGNDQLFQVYKSIQKARKISPALQSPNRYFIDGDGFNSKIFATVKYEENNALSVGKDVVMGFANLDRWNMQSDNFKIPLALADIIGLADERQYNVINLSAYERDGVITNRTNNFLWNTPVTRNELINNGFYVSLNKVPINDTDWDTNPFEAQYLKLVDVTNPIEVSINSIELIDDKINISCSSTPGWFYKLEYKNELSDPNWITISSNTKATDSNLVLTVDGSVVEDQFYKITASYIEIDE